MRNPISHCPDCGGALPPSARVCAHCAAAAARDAREALKQVRSLLRRTGQPDGNPGRLESSPTASETFRSASELWKEAKVSWERARSAAQSRQEDESGVAGTSAAREAPPIGMVPSINVVANAAEIEVPVDEPPLTGKGREELLTLIARYSATKKEEAPGG